MINCGEKNYDFYVKKHIDIDISCNFTTMGLNCFLICILIFLFAPVFLINTSFNILVNCQRNECVKLRQLLKCEFMTVLATLCYICFHMINAFIIISITLHPKLQLEYISLTLANSIIQTCFIEKISGSNIEIQIFWKKLTFCPFHFFIFMTWYVLLIITSYDIP